MPQNTSNQSSGVFKGIQRAIDISIPLIQRKRELSEEKRRWDSMKKMGDLKFVFEVQKAQAAEKAAKNEIERENAKTFIESVTKLAPIAGMDMSVLDEPLSKLGYSPGIKGSIPPKAKLEGDIAQQKADIKLSADKELERYKQGFQKEYKPSTEEEALRLRQAGRSSVTTNVDVGAKPMQKLGEEMAKEIAQKRKEIVDISNNYKYLSDTKKLLDKGIVSGTGANFIVGFGKILQRLGLNYFDDPIANTEAFVSSMGRQVGSIIKQFGSGTGLSDADREYAEKIAGGKITLSEKSIRKIIDMNERGMRSVIKNFNNDAKQAMGKPGAESLPYSLAVEEPWTTKNVTEMSDDELLKSLGVK